MANPRTCDFIYMIITLLYVIIACSLVAPLANYYSPKKISPLIESAINNNLKKFPIFDIKDNCKDDEFILGEFEGTKKGYFSTIFESIGEDCRGKCLPVPAIPPMKYKILKNKRLCTTKSNKNYFDYYKLSVVNNTQCKSGYQPCGYLDKYDRILCLPQNEQCPINDIVYNNQNSYFHNNITYQTIKINENEYLHYTNKNIKGYIIIGLSSIFGSIPCGSHEGNFQVISKLDNFATCFIESSTIIDKTGDLFYYKFLTYYNIEKFFGENGIKEYLFENNDYKKIKNNDMNIFAVGYIGLSNIFIIENKPKVTFISDIKSYINMKSTCSFICFILIIVLGGYTIIAIPISMSIGNIIAKLITMGIENLILLMIIICSLIEIITGDLIFIPRGLFPSFYFTGIYECKKNATGKAHFWPFMPLFIINIPFFIFYIMYRKKSKFGFLFEQSNNNPNNINSNLINNYEQKNYPIQQNPNIIGYSNPPIYNISPGYS